MIKKRAIKRVRKAATRRPAKARRTGRRKTRKPAAKKTSVKKVPRKRKVAAVKRPAKRPAKITKPRVVAVRRRVTKPKVVRGKKTPAVKRISPAVAKPVFVRIKPFELRGLVNLVAQPPSAELATPSRTVRVEVPTILLEGDHAELPPPPHVPGKKFALGPTTSESPRSQPQTELPAGYGSGTIHATARDPHWLYVNWDFTREQQMQFNTRSAHGHLVLRVQADEPKSPAAAEVHVHPESRHWFVHVERDDACYVVQLGFYDKRKSWNAVATAAPVHTPGKKTGAPGVLKFATIHPDQPFAEIQQRAEQSGLGELLLTEALARLRAAGQFDSSTDQAPSVELTPEAAARFFRLEFGKEFPSPAWSSIDWALTGT